jgi:hypothetical protein
VVATILEYGASYRIADEYGFLDIERIHADAGLEFISALFKVGSYNNFSRISWY